MTTTAVGGFVPSPSTRITEPHGRPQEPAAPAADVDTGTFSAPPSWESLEQGFGEVPEQASEPTHVEAEEEAPHRSAYTWLHMIVLVLLAFVLGMVVWMVINRDGPPAQEPEEPQSQSVVSLAVPSWR